MTLIQIALECRHLLSTRRVHRQCRYANLLWALLCQQLCFLCNALECLIVWTKHFCCCSYCCCPDSKRMSLSLALHFTSLTCYFCLFTLLFLFVCFLCLLWLVICTLSHNTMARTQEKMLIKAVKCKRKRKRFSILKTFLASIVHFHLVFFLVFHFLFADSFDSCFYIATIRMNSNIMNFI